MEKVILTKEQAEAIELNRKVDSNGELLSDYFGEYPVSHWSRKAIRRMDLDVLVKALYIGYEVGTEYTIGDWLFHKPTGRVAQIDTRYDGGNELWVLDEEFNFFHIDDSRPATPSEIAEEKERRWWAKLDRGNNEYRVTDIVQYEYEKGLFEIVSVYNTTHVELTNDSCDTSFTAAVDKLKLACPAENRLDVKTNE